MKLSVVNRIWGSLSDVCNCLTVAALSSSGALSDERSGLSLVVVSSLHKLFTFYMLDMCWCIYNIYKASVSAGPVQLIMAYRP
jgi:hypothetical protein